MDMAALPEFVETEVGRPARILAALVPKMIALSAEGADGAIPYLFTPKQTRRTRQIVGSDKRVVTEQPVAFEGSENDWVARVSKHMAYYLRFR